MKTGNLRVLGNLKADVWQRIYDSGEILVLDSYTKLLIQGNAIADSTGKTVTANGSASVTSAQYKFSQVGNSIVFNGTTDYLTLADSDDWYFGTGDFTIDCWVRFNDITNQQTIVCQSNLTGSERWFFSKASNSSGNKLLFFAETVAGGALANYIMTNDWSVSTGIWYHVALVRSTTSIKIFIDGVSQTMTENTAINGNDLGNISGLLYIGSQISAVGQYLDGWISMCRVSKGIARWTSNFTPPVYTDYGGATTSITISGLDGDTDVEYRLISRHINGYTSGVSQYLRFNGDSGTNYGHQYVSGSDTTAEASRYGLNNGVFLVDQNSTGDISILDLILYSKSGYVRNGIYERIKFNSSVPAAIFILGFSWNNTADNITSITLLANQINGIGVGSRIELYRRLSPS